MRQYRGNSAEERRLERREKLLHAAARIFAGRGFHNATVRAVCEEAGLTERYFYESFQNSEALFLALHRETSQRIIGIIREVPVNTARPDEQMREMLGRFFNFFTTDPDDARMFAVEAVYISPVAREVCKSWRETLGQILLQTLNPGRSVTENIVSTAVARGLLSIAVDWMEDGFSRPRSEILDAGMQLVSVLRLERPEGSA